MELHIQKSLIVVQNGTGELIHTSGDLYEAEEVFLSGKCFEPNRLVFVHYPDGEVFEPIAAKEKNYLMNFREETVL